MICRVCGEEITEYYNGRPEVCKECERMRKNKNVQVTEYHFPKATVKTVSGEIHYDEWIVGEYQRLKAQGCEPLLKISDKGLALWKRK